MPSRFLSALFFVIMLGLTADAGAQSLDLPVRGYGLSIGDSRHHAGLRLNFRDRRLRSVKGVNITIWTPYNPARAEVQGIAIGLPMTGGRDLQGVSMALFGAGAERSIRGITLAGIGAGAGESITGIAIGGIGAGAGGSVRGIMIGGIGAGAGGSASGVMIGGIGAGAGGNVQGLVLAGIGAGAGGNFHGISASGIGSGAGGDLSGIHVAGVAVGAGGDASGILVGGIAAGSGGELRGLAIGGIAVGAPIIRAIVLSGLTAGGEDVSGIVIAPAYFNVTENGLMNGLSVSAVNRIQGRQNGLTIGIINIARDLRGVQLGLLNYAGSNRRGLRLLPFINMRMQ
jgi:hypothetical protein